MFFKVSWIAAARALFESGSQFMGWRLAGVKTAHIRKLKRDDSVSCLLRDKLLIIGGREQAVEFAGIF
jgi:hypothetical protein